MAENPNNNAESALTAHGDVTVQEEKRHIKKVRVKRKVPTSDEEALHHQAKQPDAALAGSMGAPRLKRKPSAQKSEKTHKNNIRLSDLPKEEKK